MSYVDRTVQEVGQSNLSTKSSGWRKWPVIERAVKSILPWTTAEQGKKPFTATSTVRRSGNFGPAKTRKDFNASRRM